MGREDRLQQLPPLRAENSPTQTLIGKRLKEADQIDCSSWVLERKGQETGPRPAHQTGADCRTPGLLGQTSNRPLGVQRP